MIDDVGSRGVATRVTEPFGADEALDHRRWGMNTAVAG